MIEYEGQPAQSIPPATPGSDAEMPGPTHLLLRGHLPPRLCSMLRARVPGYLRPGEVPQLEKAVRRTIGTVQQRYGRIGATLSELKLMRYGVGAYMRPHRDNDYEGAVFPGQISAAGTVPWGMNIYLSRPGVDYEGGAVVVEGEEIVPPAGSVVVVRGDVLHHVETVTSGERWIVKALVSIPADTRWSLRNGRWA